MPCGCDSKMKFLFSRSVRFIKGFVMCFFMDSCNVALYPVLDFMAFMFLSSHRCGRKCITAKAFGCLSGPVEVDSTTCSQSVWQSFHIISDRVQ